MTSRARVRRRGEGAEVVSSPVAGVAPGASARPPWNGGSIAGRWGPVAVVVLATIAAYSPVLKNGFVDFDDQTNILENPGFRSLGSSGLHWMFTNLDGHYL